VCPPHDRGKEEGGGATFSLFSSAVKGKIKQGEPRAALENHRKLDGKGGRDLKDLCLLFTFGV
jgi:hypothetical protein